MAQTIDKKTIQAAQNGDEKAFEQLVNESYEMMYKMAYKYCGNPDDAADITQDACIKLGRSIDKFRHDSAFSSWVYRIVVNTAKDWFKKQNRHQASPDALETLAFNNKIEDKLYAQQVFSHIETLPDGEKDALILVFAEGLSHKEAANILECKESTISWRIHEARKKLEAAFPNISNKEQSHG